MTPVEQFEFKQKWKPGYQVKLHSDLADRGKTWCRRNIESHRWSFTAWTDVYEHTFHFQWLAKAEEFEKNFSEYAKLVVD